MQAAAAGPACARPTRPSPTAADGTGRRRRRCSIRSARGPHGRLWKRTKGLLGQHRVAIFPDLLDLAVLETKHETIVVVVAHAFWRDIVALCFDDDDIAVGDEAMSDRPRPVDKAGPHIAVQIVEDRLFARKGARPGILAGHHPFGVVGKTFGEQATVAPSRIGAGGGCKDILHQFLVGARAHGGISLGENTEIIAAGSKFFKSIVDMISIRLMNLNSLDLNLLTALDALLREANVSRAALRIGLSQPAASHALQRLRDIFRDPLLVRTGARMELTPRAQALRAPLAQALDHVRGLFLSDEFDAARSERQFRLMMPDLAVELLMPPLMEKVTQAAP